MKKWLVIILAALVLFSCAGAAIAKVQAYKVSFSVIDPNGNVTNFGETFDSPAEVGKYISSTMSLAKTLAKQGYRLENLKVEPIKE